ncbi:hypothetical protein X975_04680, partial [Stegodyphus mimosarum]
MVHHIISRIFGLKWEVKNKEYLDSKEPYILVCNHQSALDISGMMYIWPLFHPCVPVLKRELLFSGPFGIFCWLAGCVFVDRFNSEKARDTLNMKIKEMKDRKVKLWIFPEGTRNDKETLLPFKKGAFHIATQTKHFLFEKVSLLKMDYRYYRHPCLHHLLANGRLQLAAAKD